MLERLNTLYDQGDNLQAYQKALEVSRRQLYYSFPGLTIIRAEAADRDYAPAMTHVLAPEPENTKHKLGWHDTMMGQLSLDDGQTPVSSLESCEVQQKDGSWLAGTVSAGDVTFQAHAYLLTTSAGQEYILKHGDIVRKIVFRNE
jgi:hypothetical protein